MVTFSAFPSDPRPRRAVEALLIEGAVVDLICLGQAQGASREKKAGLTVTRVPIAHTRGGKFCYVYEYSTFLLVSAALMATRTLRRRYDLVYVHNMPDVLVFSSLVPKTLGAKVVLDLHDPMPELMATIFTKDRDSRSVRLIRWLEKCSVQYADAVVTVNAACKRIFSSRSCVPEKISVVMNSPDEQIFPIRSPLRRSATQRSNNGTLKIMYHGSLVQRNGLDLAAAAVARVRQRIPGVQLKVYGQETPFLREVMDYVRDNKLEEHVTYCGPRRLEELVQEIEACDVGVIPNHRNLFTDINTPTRLFEYLMLGKPVIAPRTSGIQDYFGPDSLVYFESGSISGLATAFEYVATHYDEALASAAKGQEVYLAHRWCDERQVLIDLLRNICSGRVGAHQKLEIQCCPNDVQSTRRAE